MFTARGRGRLIECSVNRENGDELPNRFLGSRRLGCTLPCALRLRTQRSDHMAVGYVAPRSDPVQSFSNNKREKVLPFGSPVTSRTL
jgi:hypothetical protein